MSPDATEERGAERSRPRYRLLGGGVHPEKKRKGQDNWTLSPALSLHPLYTPSNATSHWITDTLIKGEFLALRLSRSLSRRTQSTGAKDGGHTGYSVPGILIRTQWSLMLCQLCVCVKASTTPLYADTHTHTHSTHPERAHSITMTPTAGGARATIAWAGICSRPAVETPANGKDCLKSLTARCCTVMGRGQRNTGRETWGRLIHGVRNGS